MKWALLIGTVLAAVVALLAILTNLGLVGNTQTSSSAGTMTVTAVLPIVPLTTDLPSRSSAASSAVTPPSDSPRETLTQASPSSALQVIPEAEGQDLLDPIRHQAVVTIANDRGIDLDAPASDPHWGSEFMSELHFRYSAWPFITSGKGYWLKVDTGAVDYETCSTSTGYAYDVMYRLDDDLMPNEIFCVKTSDDRYSTVQYLDSTNESAKFKVTTFE